MDLMATVLVNVFMDVANRSNCVFPFFFRDHSLVFVNLQCCRSGDELTLSPMRVLSERVFPVCQLINIVCPRANVMLGNIKPIVWLQFPCRQV